MASHDYHMKSELNRSRGKSHVGGQKIEKQNILNYNGSSLRWRTAFCILLLEFQLVYSEVDHCDFDCLYPRRPETEELFNRVGHHERSASLKETMDKVNVRISSHPQTIVAHRLRYMMHLGFYEFLIFFSWNRSFHCNSHQLLSV